MPDMLTTTISDDDMVALHVAALILRDKAKTTDSHAQQERLLAYAARLDDLITNSTVSRCD